MAVKTSRLIFAHTYWDILPVLAAIAHGLFIMAMFFAWGHVPWYVMGIMGIVYAYSIAWNVNSVSHNFIHNPYFKSPILNRLFSLLESLVCGFSQIFYDRVHRQHHIGNSDRPDENGDTIDWVSIYQHGEHGHAESVWGYTFLGFFREDVKRTYREIYRLDPVEAYWGIAENVLTISFAILGFVLKWKFMLFFLPCYYLGNCLSMLNGYYRHFGGNPDEPVAWGVSSYGKLYNWLWFNNGFHAEHHFRPRVHWTKMSELRGKFVELQKAKGHRVIQPAHVFGFLDPDVRALHREERAKIQAMSSPPTGGVSSVTP